MFFLRQLYKAALHLVLSISVLLCCFGCSKTPDEEQIQSIIDEMIFAIENNKPSGLTKHLHERFLANQNMDAQQVKQTLMLYGMQHAKISINVISLQTTIDPIYTDKAKTGLSIVVTGSSGQGLPDDGSVRTVKLEWRKDNHWKLLKADWEM